jgi:hypothetical protein
MLVSLAEASLDPGENFNVGEAAVKAAEDERLLVGDEAEGVQRAPVPAEEIDKAGLIGRPGPGTY